MAIGAALAANGGFGEDVRIYNITALDGDTGPTAFAHGLPFTPQFAIVQPAQAGCYTGRYNVTVTATTFIVTKAAGGGTGTGLGTVCQVSVGRWPSDEMR